MGATEPLPALYFLAEAMAFRLGDLFRFLVVPMLMVLADLLSLPVARKDLFS